MEKKGVGRRAGQRQRGDEEEEAGEEGAKEGAITAITVLQRRARSERDLDLHGNRHLAEGYRPDGRGAPEEDGRTPAGISEDLKNMTPVGLW